MSYPRDGSLQVSLAYAGVGQLQAISASAPGSPLGASSAPNVSGLRIWLQGGSVTFYIGRAGIPPTAPLTPVVTWAAADGPILDIPLDPFFTAVSGSPVAQRM